MVCIGFENSRILLECAFLRKHRGERASSFVDEVQLLKYSQSHEKFTYFHCASVTLTLAGNKVDRSEQNPFKLCIQ